MNTETTAASNAGSPAPYSWVAQGYLWRLFAVLSALLLISTAWLAWFGAALHTAAAPDGIVSFELARTAAESRAILDSWNTNARDAALLIQGVDYLYLLIYPAWYALAIAMLARSLGGRWQTTGQLLALAVLLAAPLDAVENYALIQQLLYGADDGQAALAYWMAVPKFVLVGAASLYIVPGGILRLARGSWSKRPLPYPEQTLLNGLEPKTAHADEVATPINRELGN